MNSARRHGRRRALRRAGGLLALSLASLLGCDRDAAQGTASVPQGPSPVPLTPYESFESSALDQARWQSTDKLRGFADRLAAAHATKAERRVQDGALRFTTAFTGETHADRGTAVGHFRVALLEQPEKVHAMEATLLVQRVETAPCAANSAATFSRTTIGGLFFNTGPPGGQKLAGDVLAVVGLGRRSDSSDPPDTLRAMAVVLVCGRPCYAFDEHVPQGREPSRALTRHDIGPVKVGEKVRLGLAWDPAHDRFVFWRDGKLVHELRYSLPDDQPPTIQRRHLDVAHFVPACASGSAVKTALDVSFDDLSIGRPPR